MLQCPQPATDEDMECTTHIWVCLSRVTIGGLCGVRARIEHGIARTSIITTGAAVREDPAALAAAVARAEASAAADVHQAASAAAVVPAEVLVAVVVPAEASVAVVVPAEASAAVVAPVAASAVVVAPVAASAAVVAVAASAVAAEDKVITTTLKSPTE